MLSKIAQAGLLLLVAVLWKFYFIFLYFVEYMYLYCIHWRQCIPYCIFLFCFAASMWHFRVWLCATARLVQLINKAFDVVVKDFIIIKLRIILWLKRAWFLMHCWNNFTRYLNLTFVVSKTFLVLKRKTITFNVLLFNHLQTNKRWARVKDFKSSFLEDKKVQVVLIKWPRISLNPQISYARVATDY
jgi:hypothetical protein